VPPLKRLFTTIIYLACFLSSQATPGPGPKAETSTPNKNALANAGAVRFRFKNLIDGLEEKDSMLIIFDRYDHTGPGAVHQVFAADRDHGITIPGIAPGKYYVTVQCVGLHRDRLEKIVTIRSQRSETVRINLTPSEMFCKKNVVIPAFHPDLSDLSVVRFK
jgi:hypothetical protein